MYDTLLGCQGQIYDTLNTIEFCSDHPLVIQSCQRMQKHVQTHSDNLSHRNHGTIVYIYLHKIINGWYLDYVDILWFSCRSIFQWMGVYLHTRPFDRSMARWRFTESQLEVGLNLGPTSQVVGWVQLISPAPGGRGKTLVGLRCWWWLKQPTPTRKIYMRVTSKWGICLPPNFFEWKIQKIFELPPAIVCVCGYIGVFTSLTPKKMDSFLGNSCVWSYRHGYGTKKPGRRETMVVNGPYTLHCH